LRLSRVLDTLVVVPDARALVAYSLQLQALLGDAVFDVEAAILDWSQPVLDSQPRIQDSHEPQHLLLLHLAHTNFLA